MDFGFDFLAAANRQQPAINHLGRGFSAGLIRRGRGALTTRRGHIRLDCREDGHRGTPIKTG
jgi:hypothetical protein